MASKPISLKEYFAVEGSLFSNKDARIIGPVIEQMAEQGGVTARDVLDAGRSTNSPLHPYFEWEDRIAADKFRLRQAGQMLNAIKVKFVDGGVQSVARAFHVERAPAYTLEPKRFHSFKVLHGETAFAAQMMRSAFEDIQSWRKKYEPYQTIWDNFSDAFAQVINQISECEDEIAQCELPAMTDEALARLMAWKEEFALANMTWRGWVDQMRFLIEAINNAERVFATEPAIKHRDCMKCGKSFVSYDSGNRICPSCSSLPSAGNVAGLLPRALG